MENEEQLFLEGLYSLALGEPFDFLHDDEDLYTLADIKAPFLDKDENNNA